jgi:hypothetical protein
MPRKVAAAQFVPPPPLTAEERELAARPFGGSVVQIALLLLGAVWIALAAATFLHEQREAASAPDGAWRLGMILRVVVRSIIGVSLIVGGVLLPRRWEHLPALMYNTLWFAFFYVGLTSVTETIAAFGESRPGDATVTILLGLLHLLALYLLILWWGRHDVRAWHEVLPDWFPHGPQTAPPSDPHAAA